MIKFVFLFNFFLFAGLSSALNNGLALTPPMGWLSWERFRCITDCDDDPDNCISEGLFTRIADTMSSQGYREAGYEYVIIDDCWMDKQRDKDGKLRADPKRFPHGIKWLANYIHSKGLKFGIYGDFGTKTCGGYPGSEFYMESDARTLAEWGVDYFKMDGCYSDPKQFDEGYPTMGYFLNKTGRPILYSCSWPAYQEESMLPNYRMIAETCNLWRNFGDIEDSWQSVLSIIDFYGQDHSHFVEVAGPGGFNDPDMLLIGNFGLSESQEEVQMALWCIMASPLIMSNQLPSIKLSSKQLLLNKHAIAINQDRLGIQGRRIKQIGQLDIWTRPIFPHGSIAFAIVNKGTSTPTKLSIRLTEMGLQSQIIYHLFEVFSDKPLPGKFHGDDLLTLRVNPSSVFFGKALPVV